jgi:hypothetical protein
MQASRAELRPSSVQASRDEGKRKNEVPTEKKKTSRK